MLPTASRQAVSISVANCVQTSRVNQCCQLRADKPCQSVLPTACRQAVSISVANCVQTSRVNQCCQLRADKPCHEDHVLLDNTCLEIVPEGKLNYSAALEACNHNYGRLAVLDTPALWGVLDMLEPFGVLKRYYLGKCRPEKSITLV